MKRKLLKLIELSSALVVLLVSTLIMGDMLGTNWSFIK